MNKYTRIIENYLNGRVTATEKQQFEDLLKKNAELKSELELQILLQKGIERSGIKIEINKGFKKGMFKAKVGRAVKIALIAGLTVSIVLAVKNKFSSSGEENIRYELNEENKKVWSDADKYLTPETFIVNGARDTVIETKGGIIYTIPAHAFLDNKGAEVNDAVEIEVKEALTPSDIMKAGLSTMSGKDLLETGGMFYMNARRDAINLTIAANKGIYTSIPNLNPGKEMMLFEGKRINYGAEDGTGNNGQIDWVNPIPFENKLTPIDILKLNFYPPHFLDSLKKFGFDITNKKLTDSIYYSFNCGVMPQYWYDESESDYPKSDSNTYVPNGEKLFRQNCVMCHSKGTQKLTGPGLSGMMDRVPKPALTWLTKYIMNNERMMKDGDTYANKIYNENGKAQMTVFEGQLSEQDVLAIINYINSDTPSTVHNSGQSACEIDPSRIHAIWNKKFNNTLIATKEFEERLQAIFKTCNKSVLDMYIKNLDKKMYQVDSLACELLSESGMQETADIFQNFYSRKNGGILISEKHMKKLQAYMSEKQKIYEESTVASLRKLYEKEKIQNEDTWKKIMKQSNAEAKRVSATFNEELEININEAYRQMGKAKPPKVFSADGYLSTTIITTGWKNVDAYVRESTISRKTLDYKDPETGKKAVIKYEKLRVEVLGFEKFDRVNAYLVPDKLSSFQRMPGSGKIFEENLNELFTYSSVIVGFKGEDIYWSKITNTKPGKITVSLTKMSKTDLRSFQSLNNNTATDLITNLNYVSFEIKDNFRQRAILKREELRIKLWLLVFPCDNHAYIQR